MKRNLLDIPGWMIASAIMSIGGIPNGYDSGTIGAVTTMPFFEARFGILSPSMRGFTVSFLLLTGAIPAFFAGQLADRYNHLRVILAGAVIFTIGAILQGTAFHLSQLLVGRAIAGIGCGLWLSNVSVYIAEIAPASRRGMLVSMPQIMACLGICVGYFTCYGSIRINNSMSWRLPFIPIASTSLALAISCLYLPISPRWLHMHGRQAEVKRAAEWLNLPSNEIYKDILRPMTDDLTQSRSWGMKDVIHIFDKEYRARTMLAFFVLGMIQLAGIDGIVYYAPILFAKAGLSQGEASFLASGVKGLLGFIITIPASYYADAWGRRTSIITGGIGLSSSMLIIGSLYASGSVHAGGAGRWAVIVLYYIFVLTYESTWGIAARIYASEIQPVETRAMANCVAQGLGFFTDWLVAFITPILLAKSTYGAYFLFGGLSLLTLIVLIVHMPETRGKSLETIEDSFKRPNAEPLRLELPILHHESKRQSQELNGKSRHDAEDVAMTAV